MMNFSRMQLDWIIFESRLEGLKRPTFQTDGDFLTGVGGDLSTSNVIDHSQHWMGDGEIEAARNGCAVKRGLPLPHPFLARLRGQDWFQLLRPRQLSVFLAAHV